MRAEKKQRSAPKKARPHTSLAVKLLILTLLVGMGVTLYRLYPQVAEGRERVSQLSAQVESRQQENAALAEDIEEGPTPEKMEEIAREQLGMVSEGERVFYDVSN